MNKSSSKFKIYNNVMTVNATLLSICQKYVLFQMTFLGKIQVILTLERLVKIE